MAILTQLSPSGVPGKRYDFSGKVPIVIAYNGAKMLGSVEMTKSWQQVFTDEGWSTFQDQIDAGFPITIQPSVVTAAVWEEKIDFGEVFTSAIITFNYQTTQVDGNVVVVPTISYSEDDISYTDVSSQLQVLAEDFQYVKFKLTLTGDDRTSLAIVEGMNVKVDVKTETESGRTEVTANPTSITYTTSFIGTPKIVPSYEGTSLLIAIAGNQSSTGCDLYLFDKDGVDASASTRYVNWVAEGPVG